MSRYKVTPEEQEEDSANAGDPTNKNDSTISRWIKAIKKRKFDFGFPVNPPTEHLLATRHNKLKAILSNKCTDRINITSVLLCFMGIALSIISTSFLTCWPQQFPLGNDQYWFETMILFTLTYGSLSAAVVTNISVFFLGAPKKSWIRPFLLIFILGSFSILFIVSLCYIVWSILGKQVYPMPFQGYIGGIFGWQLMLLIQYWLFPKNWKSDASIKKRINLTMIYLESRAVGCFMYWVIHRVFLSVPTHVQPALILVLLFIREANAWTSSYIGKRCLSFEDDLSAEIHATHYAAVRHVIFLSVNLGSTTSDITSYLLLAVDFTINIIFCLLTLWYNRHEKDEEKKVCTLLNLIINEAVECTMPIAYLVSLLFAYYGPNRDILQGIGFGEWHQAAIEDFGNTVFWIIAIFLSDFGSTVISAILLKVIAGMNIFKMYSQLQNEIGHLLIVDQGYIMTEVKLLKIHHIKGKRD